MWNQYFWDKVELLCQSETKLKFKFQPSRWDIYNVPLKRDNLLKYKTRISFSPSQRKLKIVCYLIYQHKSPLRHALLWRKSIKELSLERGWIAGNRPENEMFYVCTKWDAPRHLFLVVHQIVEVRVRYMTRHSVKYNRRTEILMARSFYLINAVYNDQKHIQLEFSNHCQCEM